MKRYGSTWTFFFLSMVESHSFGMALTTPSKGKYWSGVSFASRIFSLPRKILSLDTNSDLTYSTCVVKEGMIQRFTIIQNALIIPHKLVHYILVRTLFLACESGPCILASFKTTRWHCKMNFPPFKRLWIYESHISSYFFQIITQENFPRTSIIISFNKPLQTHGSLCQNHRFKVKHP